MPAASTSATSVAIGGSTATSCAPAGTVAVDGPDAGATVVDGVVGAAAAAIAGSGSDDGGVVLVPRAAAVVLGVVRAGIGIEDGSDDARGGLRVRTVVTARIAATPTRARRTDRRIRRGRPGSDAPTRCGEAGASLSTMC
jgi:hypothetical protein